MDFEKEVLKFIEHMQTIYFEERDWASLLPYMDLDTSWIGTGAHELCRNLEDVQSALSMETQEYSGGFTIINAKHEVQQLAENTCVVYGEITAKAVDANIADVYYRLTAVCVRTSDGIRLAHLHASTPDADQEQGRFYVTQDKFGERKTLQLHAQKVSAELRDRNSQLEALTENIPGGVHQCKSDGHLTLLNMSNSFHTLTGYTKEEIEEKFNNRFVDMIHPEDVAQVKEDIEKQLLCDSSLELEYRIIRSDGNVLWILDQSKLVTLADGSTCFYCMLMDITSQKQEREELRLSLERHQIIMDQTTDIIFEWDIREDSLIFSQNWRKKFGYDAIKSNISAGIPKSQNIHPDDMQSFIKIMMDSAAGIPYSEAEFRIKNILGNFIWTRIRATIQCDLKGTPIKAVGVITDIDADKKHKQRLMDQAQRDPLTNLYNKTAVRELTEQKMLEYGSDFYQALLIIDVDYFKNVNDTYGHLCGDSLLSDIANVLKNQFRSNDIVGRIGGDEFLVYLPQIAGKNEAASKISTVLDALRTLRPASDAPSITCSIGVALFPQKSADFFTLYKCADTALYQIKARGRNNFAFYDPNDSENQVPTTIRTAVGAIDTNSNGTIDSVGEKLAQYTFQILYDSIDTETAVSKLLEIVGRAYDVSRVYIFESTEDGLKCNNTFEWCNIGVPPEIDKLKDLHYKDDLDDYQKNFNENNLFYCHDINKLEPVLYDILAPQGICSILQCAIMDDGVFKGYVGFDECRENRSWTIEQINSLTLISNVLSTFLLKFRLKEQIERYTNPIN